MTSDQSFGDEIKKIAVPITVQSVLMAGLSMTDQLMVGQLGETPIAAAGIGSKVTSIVMVVLAGLATGTSIYCAQHWGKGDHARIRQLLGLGLMLGLAFASVMSLLIGLFPQLVVSPFTTDDALLLVSGKFVQLLAIGFVPMTCTMIYSAVLRSTEQVKLPVYASAIAVALNVVLDFLLIFGHMGLPEMGLMGAALGTTLARFVEFAIILGGAYWVRHVVAVRRLSELRGTSLRLARGFLVVALPLAVNELVWVLGESAYVVVYGRMGIDSLAAMSMTFPLQGLSIGLLSGVAGAAAVLVGKRLGRDDFDGAVVFSNRVIWLGVRFAVLVGVAVAAISGLYVSVFQTSPEVQRAGQYCTFVFCGFLWVKVANMILAGAVLNSGGDTRFVLIMESLATWLVGVPVAFLAAFWLDLPVHWVCLLLSVEEIVRLAVGYRRLASRRWARNLVETNAP